MPKLLYQRLVHQKYRKSFWLRLGKHFPTVEKGSHFLVWIHAVSMGETKAIAPLASLLKKEWKECLLVVSSVTETGHTEAKRSLPFADYHVYLPFDFKSIVKPVVDQVVPDLVILSETDLWYNFLSCAKQRGAKLAVVNGKLSERSLSRFQKVPFFSRRLFGLFDLFCVQNAIYQKRFEQVGVPPEKIIATGNLKFDAEPPFLSPEELDTWRGELGVSATNPIVVLGSTHHPEEELFLSQLCVVWEKHPDLVAFFVPRHPERFDAVANLLKAKNIPFRRLSEKGQGKEKVLLVDAMGVLRKCYQLADIAVVGGSHTPKVGGHNVLEPCWYGVPTLFGPHMYAQQELAELLTQSGAGRQVVAEDLSKMLTSLLEDQNQHQMMGKAGRHLTQSLRGTTEKTWKAIKKTQIASTVLEPTH